MKFEDIKAKQIYRTKTWSVTEDRKICSALLYVWSVGKKTLKYELIACETDPVIYLLGTKKTIRQVAGMKVNSYIPVPQEDLPLYIHYPLKGSTFERLLKGLKPLKSKRIITYKK